MVWKRVYGCGFVAFRDGPGQYILGVQGVLQRRGVNHMSEG